jgi:hypothetical protein
MSKIPQLPAATEGGDLVPIIPWQQFAPMATHCWREAGGYERWRDIMKADPDKFHELAMTLTKKTMPNTNINVNVGVEDLLAKLDEQERRTIDATPA